jgi:hypothetical protein
MSATVSGIYWVARSSRRRQRSWLFEIRIRSSREAKTRCITARKKSVAGLPPLRASLPLHRASSTGE